jgi:beta-galactosidase GanA
MPLNSKMFPRVTFTLLLCATVCAMAQTAPLPQIRQNGAVKQFFVDNKPFVMLAGELHNSTASSAEYMKPVWNKLAAMHLNTVVSTVSWELMEPEEGKFDFSLVDSQIKEARQRNMRLVMIWFATWKNATSPYVPHWVKAIASASRLWSSSRGAAARGEEWAAAESARLVPWGRRRSRRTPRHSVS